MGLKDKSLELKDKLTDGLQRWADGRIDQFVKENPKIAPVGKYLKRGISNMIIKEDARMEKAVDNLMVFIADENGNYDMNTLFDDIMSMFKMMPESPFDLTLIHGTVGNGIIRVMLPDNPVASLLLGNMGAIKITEDDFRELKAVLLQKK